VAGADRELRAELEALQAANRALAADAALEVSPELGDARGALEAQLVAAEHRLVGLEEAGDRARSELAQLRTVAAALTERHQRREHEDVSALVWPLVIAVPMLVAWGAAQLGVPVQAGVAAAGFVLPALWGPRALRSLERRWDARGARGARTTGPSNRPS
jgi:hypothetical protein